MRQPSEDQKVCTRLRGRAGFGPWGSRRRRDQETDRHWHVSPLLFRAGQRVVAHEHRCRPRVSLDGLDDLPLRASRIGNHGMRRRRFGVCRTSSAIRLTGVHTTTTSASATPVSRSVVPRVIAPIARPIRVRTGLGPRRSPRMPAHHPAQVRSTRQSTRRRQSRRFPDAPTHDPLDAQPRRAEQTDQ